MLRSVRRSGGNGCRNRRHVDGARVLRETLGKRADWTALCPCDPIPVPPSGLQVGHLLSEGLRELEEGLGQALSITLKPTVRPSGVVSDVPVRRPAQLFQKANLLRQAGRVEGIARSRNLNETFSAAVNGCRAMACTRGDTSRCNVILILHKRLYGSYVQRMAIAYEGIDLARATDGCLVVSANVS